jgi:hypothetical protein
VVLKEIKKGQTGTGLLIEHDGYISLEDDSNRILKEEMDEAFAKGVWHIPYPFIVNAIFQKSNTENANKRIYPRDILEREIKKYIEKITERRGYGECNHPEAITIDLSNLSHNIIELGWQGNTVTGKMEILLSPGYIKHGVISCAGDRIANILYFNKLKIGVSSRGVGSVEQKFGKTVVQPDFELICWDIVSDPSTPGAWIGNSTQELSQYFENKDTYQDRKCLLEKLDSILKISV